MKRLFFLILVIISVAARGQTNDSTKYINYKYQYGMRMPRAWWDSVLRIPVRDTSAIGHTPGRIMMRTQDSLFYIDNGTKWNQVSGGVTYVTEPFIGGGTFPDPLTIDQYKVFDPLYLVGWGQSKTNGYDSGGGDTTIDNNVTGYDYVTSQWVVLRRGVRPLGQLTPGVYSDRPNSNNALWHFAKYLSKKYKRRVRVIILGYGGNSIVNWMGQNSTNYRYSDSIMAAIGSPRIDFFVWNQGEGDSGSGWGIAGADYNGMRDTTYTHKLDTLISQLRTETWFPPTTPIILTGLDYEHVYNYQVPHYAQVGYANGKDPYVFFADTKGLTWNPSENVHLDGPGNVTLGAERYPQALENQNYHGVVKRMTTSERANAIIAAPRLLENMLVTDIEDKKTYYIFDSTWAETAGTGGGPTTNFYTTDGTITGNRTVTQGSNILAFRGVNGHILFQDNILGDNGAKLQIEGRLALRGVNARLDIEDATNPNHYVAMSRYIHRLQFQGTYGPDSSIVITPLAIDYATQKLYSQRRLTWTAADSLAFVPKYMMDSVLAAGGASLWTLTALGNAYRNTKIMVGSTSEPTYQVHVKGNVDGDYKVAVENTNTGGSANASFDALNDIGQRGAFGITSDNYAGAIQSKTNYHYTDATNGMLFQTAGAAAPIKFLTNNTLRWQFDAAGDLTTTANRVILPDLSNNSSLQIGTFEAQSFAVNNGFLADNLYFDGGGFKRRRTGYGAIAYFGFGEFFIQTTGTAAAGSTATLTTPFSTNLAGDVGMGGDISSRTTMAGAAIVARATGLSEFKKQASYLAAFNLTALNLVHKSAMDSAITAGAPNNSYRTILEGSGSITASNANGTYGFPSGESMVLSGGGSAYPMQIIYIRAADYPTVNGLATKLRVVGELFTNDVAPTGNFTYGLYPVTRPGTSGGGGTLIYTLGTVVSGSNGGSLTFTAPAADGMNHGEGADFAIPADGYYVLGVLTTASIASLAHVHMNVKLQMRNN